MEKEKKYRVALYCRVATKQQAEDALAAQKERLRQYAEQQCYTVVAEVAEVGSGLSLQRPGIRELSGMARRRAMDEVLTLEVSRIGRNTGDVLHFEERLQNQCVRLNTPQGNPPDGLPEDAQSVQAPKRIK